MTIKETEMAENPNITLPKHNVTFFSVKLARWWAVVFPDGSTGAYTYDACARLVCEKVVWPKPDQPDRLLRPCKKHCFMIYYYWYIIVAGPQRRETKMQVTETEEAAWRLNTGNVCSRPFFVHCNALFIDIGAWRRGRYFGLRAKVHQI